MKILILPFAIVARVVIETQFKLRNRILSMHRERSEIMKRFICLLCFLIFFACAFGAIACVRTEEIAPIEEAQLEATETVAATTAVPTSTPTLAPKQNMKACDENGFSLTESVFVSTLLDVLNGKSTFMDSSDSYVVDKKDVSYAMYKNGSYTTQMIACMKNGEATGISGAMDYSMLFAMGDSDTLKSNYDTFHLYSLALIYLTNSGVSTYDQAEDFYQEVINAGKNSEDAIWFKFGKLEYSYSETNINSDSYLEVFGIRESDQY